MPTVKSPFDDIKERETIEENKEEFPDSMLEKKKLFEDDDDISKTPFGLIKERGYSEEAPYQGQLKRQNFLVFHLEPYSS